MNFSAKAYSSGFSAKKSSLAVAAKAYALGYASRKSSIATSSSTFTFTIGAKA